MARANVAKKPLPAPGAMVVVRDEEWIVRSVRPSSKGHFSVHVVGTSEVNGERVFVLRMLQARKQHWAYQPFFAEFNDEAVWIDELRPAFGEEKFFYEEELAELFSELTKERDGQEEDSSDEVPIEQEEAVWF